jgi:transcriptional regulator with XRE-family HTH domain
MRDSQTTEAAIRAEMARRGVLQKDIARVLGISTQGVSERLNGHTRITVDELVQIAALLDVEVGALVATPDTRRAMRQAS